MGLVAGSLHFHITEYMPLRHPTSVPGRLRRRFEGLWTGMGGTGGWELGGAEGGWGEGSFILDTNRKKTL